MDIPEVKLRDLDRWRDSSAYEDDERLVLELAEATTATPADVTDDLRDRLRTRFTERQLVELVTAIAWEGFRARFNRAFAISAQGFSEGAYCVLPDAHGPKGN
jgi:alkylhydroperoxidase family enzyme